MNVKTVVVGDTTPVLAQYTIQLDPQARLVLPETFMTDLAKTQGVFYVSMGDISEANFIALLESADRIIMMPAPWADQNMYDMSLMVCRNQSHFKPVENLPADRFEYMAPTARQSGRHVWTFGGSIVAGAGLTEPNKECFGYHLSQLIGHPLINQGRHGTGLRYAFESLINSDIAAGDLIFLDVVVPERVRRYIDGEVRDLQVSDLSREEIMAWRDDQAFYDQMSYLDYFVKHCDRCCAHLVFYDHQPQRANYLKYLTHYSIYPNYCLIDEFIDYADDGLHPGPKSHRRIAKNLYQHLQKL